MRLFARLLKLTLAGAIAVVIMTPALAHHGWRWTAGGVFELTGIIESTRLGNPHGIVTINADGEKWTAEVGQPWRNERVGLTDEMFAKGREIKILGKRSSDEKELRVKAERVVMDGKNFDLYPERIAE